MQRQAFTLSYNTHSSASSTEPSQGTFGQKPCHVRAFTLAEVLLTLAVIGVVAALTIPAIITKVTKDQYATGLKKAYNTLKSVEREAVQEHGEMANWDWTGDCQTIFNNYFKPHFDILKDCGTTTDDGCFAGINSYKYLNDTDAPTNFNVVSVYKIITSDGISYSYLKVPTTSRQGFFWVDINGKKKPNKFGRDLFGFEVFPILGIKPAGAFNNTTAEIITSTDLNAANGEGCNPAGGQGQYCAAKVLSEGAMNY